MIPYIGLYLFIFFISLMEYFKFKYFYNNKIIINFFVLSFLILFMGMKYHVGGDWGTYIEFFNKSTQTTKFSFSDDLGFLFLNIFFKKINFDFYIINIFSAVIFIYGTHSIAKYYENYWLFFLILLPYFILVIGMGYTRQSISIGLALFSISLFYKRITLQRILLYYVIIAIAMTFHKSVIILLPLPIFFLKINIRNLLLLVSLLYLLFFIFYSIILNDTILERLRYFFKSEYSSMGAYFRSMILSAAALFYLILGKFFSKKKQINIINKFISIYILFISLILFISPSTVIFDRLLVYFYVIIPTIICELLEKISDNNQKLFIYLFISALGLLFLWLWLLFADNSFSWIPYRTYYLDG